MHRLVICLFAAVALAGPASAATINVTRFDDPAPIICLSGLDCTLREAVDKANADAGVDVIQLPAGTYTLSGGRLPTTSESLTIQGAGASATVITGSTTATVVSPAGAVIATVGGTLTIRGVTLAGNRLTGTAAIGSGAVAASGATIVVESSVLRDNRTEAASSDTGSGAIAASAGVGLTVSDSAIEDNVHAGSGAGLAAGGIGWSGTGSGPGVTIVRSSISRNRSEIFNSAAGGLMVNNAVSLTIIDSTVSANSTSAAGGGVFRGGGIVSFIGATAVTLTGATITDNVSGGPGGTVSGNLMLLGSATGSAANSIVAGGRPTNCVTSSPITSSGGNLEDANTCGFAGPGDLVSTDPQLGALRSNGGLGRTQAPLPSSPVFGLARPALCSAADQRGVARPVGGACDSGAFEGTPPPMNTGLPSVAGTIAVGQTLTCSPGSWTGAPTFGFVWLRDGSAVSGATGSTYLISAADLGTAVQCQVTATNVAGAVVATSLAVVSPANSTRPSIAGIPRTGQRLTCVPGTWSGSPTLAVSWLRSGTAVPGAGGSSYILRAADVGRAIQCRVTATGTGGATLAESVPIVPVRACIVPALRGLTLAAARSRLAAAGCRVGVIRTRVASGRPGRVLASSPAAGRSLPVGARIGITLSKR